MKLQFTKQAREEFLRIVSVFAEIVTESIENNRENIWFSRFILYLRNADHGVGSNDLRTLMC